MGNVAGVGQFLEAVGGPATQQGTQTGAADSSSRGQDFATALQQAGGPGSTDSNGSGRGPVDAESSASKASNTSSSSAGTAVSSSTDVGQSERGKAPGAIKAAVVVQPVLSGAVTGQLLGKTSRTALAATNLTGGRQVQTAADQSSEIATVPGDFSPSQTGLGKATAPTVSLSGTVPSATVKGQSVGPTVPGAVDNADLALTVSSASVKSPRVPATGAKKTEEVTAGDGKPVEKAVAGHSKPTAMVSQGVIATAQGNELAAGAVPVFVPTAVTAPQFVADAAHEGAAATVAANPSAVAAASRMAGAQAGNGQPADKAMDAAMVATSAGTKTASALADVKLYAAQGELTTAPSGVAQGVMAEQKAALVGSVATLVADASKVGAGAASSGQLEVGSTAVGGALDPASHAVRGGLQTPGIAGVPAVKTVLQGGLVPAASVVDAAGEASVEAGTAGLTVSAAKSPEVGAVPVASGSKTTTRAAVVDAKAGVRAAVATAPVQGAPVVAKAAGATEELVAPATAAKASEGAGHAVAAQPAALAVELVPVIAGSVPVAAAHELGGGAVGVGGTTGTAALSSGFGGVAGTQEAGGTSGLAHTTLSSTATSLEVGVSSGTHGWLKIRAELNAAGTVDASLTGTSAASAERLRTELPGLNNFLLNERVAMGSLDVRSAAHAVVAAGESSATFSQAGSGQGSAGQGGNPQSNPAGSGVSADAGSAGGRAQQQASQPGDSVPVVNGVGGVDEVVLGRASDTAMYANSMELDDNAAASSVGYGAGGGWLNVRA